jgi:hypothetical protein
MPETNSRLIRTEKSWDSGHVLDLILVEKLEYKKLLSPLEWSLRYCVHGCSQS